MVWLVARPRSLRLVVTLTLSYLLVFLVPVVSMLLYYYPLTNRIITQKETNWTGYSIEQVRQTLDGVLSYVYDLPGDLINNQDLYLGPRGDDWDRWATAREFRKHARSDHFVYNTLLYLRRDGYLYSVDGTAAPAAEVLQPQTGYSYPAWPTKQILETLTHPDGVAVRRSEPVVVPVNNSRRIITFLVPVPINSRHPVGTLVVLVREDSVLELIRPIAQRTAGEVWISDENGSLIVGVGTDGLVLSTPPLETSLSSRSGVNGWTIHSRYPALAQLVEISEVQTTTLLASFGLLLLGALVIAWAVRFHYLPIKMLAQFARASLSTPAKVGAKESEWDTIQGSLAALRQATVHARRNLLSRLVAGDFCSVDEFHAVARPFGLFLEQPWLSAGLIAVEPGASLPDELRGEYQNHDNRGSLWVFQDPASDDRILLFCHGDPGSPRDQLAERLPGWFGGGEPLTVAGLGSSVTRPQDLRRSLSEARQVADLLYLNQDVRWAGLEALNQNAVQNTGFPADAIQLLETVVRADDAEAIRKSVKTLLDHLGRLELRPIVTRTLSLSVVGILKSGQVHHGSAAGSAPDPALLSWSRLSRRQLSALVHRELETLCALVDQGRGDRPEAERRRILDYFEGASVAAEGPASLKAVAEAFGMSESRFSRHFKKLMGVSFKDYVDQQRVETAKRLLRETEDPVEVIGQRVGYAVSNSSSFIRSFKRSVGMTPGHYRQQPQETQP